MNIESTIINSKKSKKKARKLLLNLVHFRYTFNTLPVGSKLPKLNFYENLKVLFIKLCNPIKPNKVSPDSLQIGSSKQGISSLVGRTRKMEVFGYVC